MVPLGLPRWLSGKELTCQCRRPGFDPWRSKMPWRRKWQPTPVFLPGESHGQKSLVGQRNLAGYSPWGRKELDGTRQQPRGKCFWISNSAVQWNFWTRANLTLGNVWIDYSQTWPLAVIQQWGWPWKAGWALERKREREASVTFWGSHQTTQKGRHPGVHLCQETP